MQAVVLLTRREGKAEVGAAARSGAAERAREAATSEGEPQPDAGAGGKGDAVGPPKPACGHERCCARAAAREQNATKKPRILDATRAGGYKP